MGKQLVTVKCDVPLDRRFDELAAPAPDTEKLKSMYERFGFRSLMRELTGSSLPLPPGECWGGGTLGILQPTSR